MEQGIHTKRLFIRSFKIEDASEKFNIDSDPNVTKYTGGVKSKDESLKQLNNIINHQKQTGFVPKAVVLKESEELIGWTALEPFMVDKNKIEIAFGIARKHWGNGYATEAARAMVAVGFEEYNLDAIVAAVNTENIASIKVIEKIGFVYCKKIQWPKQGFVDYYELSKVECLS